jgi:hypothetical protein
MLGYPATLAWLTRAADDPVARHPRHLPETLDFSPHAPLFRRQLQHALLGTEGGFPLVLQEGRLHFPEELAFRARYQPFLAGGRFVGTFHVHPAGPGTPPAPFFDPQDLAGALRSDNAGFVELLLTGDHLFALVRANPYLYISAHHVTRNPLLLQEPHTTMLRRRGARTPADPTYADAYRRAGLYYFHRYQLALYEGLPEEPLRRTVTPEGQW